MTAEEEVGAAWEWVTDFDLADEENREGDLEWLVQVCDKTAHNPYEFYAKTEGQ